MSFKEPVKRFCHCCDVWIGNVDMRGKTNGIAHQDGMREYCWNCWHGWDNPSGHCSWCAQKQDEAQEFYERRREKEECEMNDKKETINPEKDEEKNTKELEDNNCVNKSN